MTSTAIQAWLVDLDGTLYHPLPVKLGMALELGCVGWQAVGLLRKFRHFHEEMREELRSNPVLEFAPNPMEEQLARTADALALPLDEVRRVVVDWMIDRPCKWLARTKRTRLLGEVEAFRAGGGRTAIVSDYPAQKKLAALGAAHLFDVVVSNGEHPRLTRLKPGSDGYLLAASELGIDPHNCLVIGDRDDADGVAARNAHMKFRLIQ